MGRKFDRYEVLKGLGRGAMGDVYLAHDPKMNRDVALKLLHTDLAGDEKYRTRFAREARALAALSHPNIVELYDYGLAENGEPYLIMEYLAGRHLGSHVRKFGPIPQSVFLAIAIELCRALECAHQANVIHRDLKPENVFIEGRRLVLTDFGIAKAVEEENPLGKRAANPMTEVIGTPGFMAPEQFEKGVLDTRTDVFALGALLYYVATRKLPFDAESPVALLRQFRETRPNPIRDSRPEFIPQVARHVQDCLAIDPDSRPARVDYLRKELTKHFNSIGYQSTRDALASFVENPELYRREDRLRVKKKLIERIKLGIQSRDALAVDEARRHLGAIDPGHDEATHISGMAEMLGQIPHVPEEGYHGHQKRRRHFAIALLLSAFGIGLGVFFSGQDFRAFPSPWPSTRPKPASLTISARPSVLKVKATESTQVYGNGYFLGRTPRFKARKLPTTATIKLEFIRKNGQKLRFELAQPQNPKRFELEVDWQKPKVRLSAQRSLPSR